MDLKVHIIPNSKSILIPVASENLDIRTVYDLKRILYKEKIYQIFDHFLYEKADYYPRALMKLATGIDLEPSLIWGKYPNSDKIYLFVCDEIQQEVKIEEIKEEKILLY